MGLRARMRMINSVATASRRPAGRKLPGIGIVFLFSLILMLPHAVAQIDWEATDGNGLVLMLETPEFVFHGQAAWFSFDLRNESSATRSDVELTVLIANKNVQPQSIPPWCELSSVEGYPELNCDIGNLQPGSSMGARVSLVQESEEEDESFIVIGGSVNEFSFSLVGGFPIIHDTLKDLDGDGVTDFIERLSGTDPNDRESTDHSIWVIDMIAMYSASARVEYSDKGGIEARIREFFDFGNDVLAASKAKIRLNLLEIAESELDDVSISANSIETFNDDRTIKVNRAEFGADLAAYFTFDSARNGNRRNCGVAYLSGVSTRGDLSHSVNRHLYSSAVNASCPLSSFIHEIGHNLGLSHSRRDEGMGAFDFSFGHGVQDSFVTIMANPYNFGAAEELPYFASPDLDCNGHSCGVPIEQEGAADAIRTINILGPQVAGYILRPWPEGMFSSPAVDNGGRTTTARMSVGIMNENGEYDSEVAPGSTVDIVAEIRPEEVDLYKNSTLHFLAEDQGGTILQVHRSGNISVWDGEAENLVPFKYNFQLQVVERFSVVEGLFLGQDFAGTSFDLSVAYRVGEKVVRMSDPTTLTITE